MNLPISIHTREALEDTYQILKEEDVRDIGGIMHSFSGDYEWAKRFLDLGMHISFSGVVTFKSIRRPRGCSKCTNRTITCGNRCPLSGTSSFRGKRNEPGYTRYTVERLLNFGIFRQKKWLPKHGQMRTDYLV